MPIARLGGCRTPRPFPWILQGQKCSACSRAILVEGVYDAVLEKIVEKARLLTVGDPAEPENDMGAVIDENAYRKIQSYIEIGKREGLLVPGGGAVRRRGRVWQPR